MKIIDESLITNHTRRAILKMFSEQAADALTSRLVDVSEEDGGEVKLTFNKGATVYLIGAFTETIDPPTVVDVGGRTVGMTASWMIFGPTDENQGGMIEPCELWFGMLLEDVTKALDARGFTHDYVPF